LTCRRARQDGFLYVWVDTVCIDKSSSAELSEAINSMFAWYQRAKVCYVFLEDVATRLPHQVDLLSVFQRSKWFTRGWTLQELLAPDHILFFSRDWVELGNKKALSGSISSVTGIDQLCLCKEKPLRDYSIAQRMSWAADRFTTREEDVAYSLLGIFDINMPLLYGEGEKAFRRLQEEIVKASDDHSIFTFDTIASQDSLMADHPRLFRDVGRIQPRFESRMTPPFHFSNAGLSLSTPLIRTLSPFWALAVLNCFEVDTSNGRRLLQICLPLLGKDSTYMRARDPVYLVKKPVMDPKLELRHEVQNLTTSTMTSYLVTYFTRVYPAFGAELDNVMKGFADDDVKKSGFLLTFPRGMANYRVVRAYPDGALQRETSLFCPPYTVGLSVSHGLVVFEECYDSPGVSTATSTTPGASRGKRIGIYLAQTDDLVACHWMCRVIPDIVQDSYECHRNSWPFEADLKNWMHRVGPAADEDFYEWCSKLRPSKADPKEWCHYDHFQHFIVAARSQLVFNKRPRQVVHVEIVFDAQAILQDISSSTSRYNLDLSIAVDPSYDCQIPT